ncbi:hypothetical protein UFOVP97_31 [uncultured Caudovirales phage]|uniref:Uncharacterized protein n=1 Tax=uncultured Caudovirales phage TaxID=2100421 RepID=A0A6J5LIG4_9CAUD|nr:hypothetical protein UFOVP97_31 [uncultured Caudovirales phage]CAB4134364.1 hypothetical protein UFOVP268_49 [uncultured Caudovirales phage]
MNDEWELVDTYEPVEINSAQTNNNTINPMQMMQDFVEDEWEPVESFESHAPNTKEEESYPAAALRHATRLGSRLVEGIGGTPKALLDLIHAVPDPVGEFVNSIYPNDPLRKLGEGIESLAPSSEQIRESISSVLPEGYTEPQGGWEEFSDELVHEVPWIASALLSGGTAGLYAAGKSLVSAAAGFGIKKAGGGPLAQFVGRMATSFGADLFKHKRSGQSIKSFAEARKEVDYKKARGPARRIYFQGRPLEREAEKILKESSGKASGMHSSGQARVSKEAQSIIDLLNKGGTRIGQVKLSKAMDQKKSLNQLARSAPTTVAGQYEAQFYKRLAGIINKQINPLEKLHPEFGAPYRKAEDIVKIIGDLDEVGSEIHQTYQTISQLPFIHKQVKYLLKGAKWMFEREPSRAIWQFYKKDPKLFQEYANGLIKSAFEKDQEGILRNVYLLNRMITGV